MVTADTVADTNGDATISIEPALLTSPANNTAVTYSSVPFTVYVDGKAIEYSTDQSGFYQFEIEMCEAF